MTRCEGTTRLLGHLDHRRELDPRNLDVPTRWLRCERSEPRNLGRWAETSTTGAASLVRLPDMEAVFIALMALVVLTTGYLALVVLHKMFASGS